MVDGDERLELGVVLTRNQRVTRKRFRHKGTQQCGLKQRQIARQEQRLVGRERRQATCQAAQRASSRIGVRHQAGGQVAPRLRVIQHDQHLGAARRRQRNGMRQERRAMRSPEPQAPFVLA